MIRDEATILADLAVCRSDLAETTRGLGEDFARVKLNEHERATHRTYWAVRNGERVPYDPAALPAAYTGDARLNATHHYNVARQTMLAAELTAARTPE